MDDTPAKLTDIQIAALAMEGEMMYPKKPREAVKAIFTAATPSAAAEIIRQALYGEKARDRLAASMYIINRVIGKDGTITEGSVTPLEDLRGSILTTTSGGAGDVEASTLEGSSAPPVEAP